MQQKLIEQARHPFVFNSSAPSFYYTGRQTSTRLSINFQIILESLLIVPQPRQYFSNQYIVYGYTYWFCLYACTTSQVCSSPQYMKRVPTRHENQILFFITHRYFCIVYCVRIDWRFRQIKALTASSIE